MTKTKEFVLHLWSLDCNDNDCQSQDINYFYGNIKNSLLKLMTAVLCLKSSMTKYTKLDYAYCSRSLGPSNVIAILYVYLLKFNFFMLSVSGNSTP